MLPVLCLLRGGSQQAHPGLPKDMPDRFGGNKLVHARRRRWVAVLVLHSVSCFRCFRQARAEDYSETLAFVRLLNALLRASAGAPLPDGAAAAFAQFAGHVREDVLGQLNQRGYKCVPTELPAFLSQPWYGCNSSCPPAESVHEFFVKTLHTHCDAKPPVLRKTLPDQLKIVADGYD